MAKKTNFEKVVQNGPPLPRDNPHVRGHDWAEQQFLDSWHSERIHHAWLLTGSEGIGKATLAYRMARFVLAGGYGQDLSLDPSHPVFRRISSGGHGDLLVLERAMDDTKGRLKKTIPVDAVRQLQGFLRMTAAEGGWRVVLIDGADTLTTEGQNALLKILEEPPRQSLLLLTAENAGSLLPTIRSRVRHLPLRSLSSDLLTEVCAHYAPHHPAHVWPALTPVAQGSVGTALNLAETGALDHLAALLSLLHQVTVHKDSQVQQWIDDVTKSKNDATLPVVQGLLVWWLGRLIQTTACQIFPEEIFPGEKSILTHFIPLASTSQWIATYDSIRDLFNRAEATHLDMRLIFLQAIRAIPC